MPAAEPLPKVDLKKSVPGFAARRGRIDIVDLPSARYLAADAAGAPEATAPPQRAQASALPALTLTQAIQTLYPVAYAIKFASKKQRGRDYVVPPLEALWWAEDLAAFTTDVDRDQWRSMALLMLPEWIDDSLIEAGRETAATKVPHEHLAQVRVETFDEQTVAQTLHVGPFADEGPVIAAMHAHIADAGLTLTGRHHEIYLSDFRKTAPEKLRTILRQPCAAAAAH